MKANSIIFILLFWELTACRNDGERFSFTLPFTITSTKKEIAVTDTLAITSGYQDTGTNYYTGDDETIGSNYFITVISLLKLGNFENGTNCKYYTNHFSFTSKIGNIVYYDSSGVNVYFYHQQETYCTSVGFIPSETGTFAIVLHDKEEIRKVFSNENFNRELLNNFNIYELNTGTDTIPVDERVYFFRVK